MKTKENSGDCFPIYQKVSSEEIAILIQAIFIQGIGHIKAHKNLKRGGYGFRKDGSKYPMSWTPRDVKAWKEKLIQLLKSQLTSLSQIGGSAISTACPQQCWTALLKHSKEFDDSIEWIVEETFSFTRVRIGDEGCIIKIELANS